MEEAYSELYQQFLQLRSLCLRQAALLHQITETLQKDKSPDGGCEIALLWNRMILMFFTPETLSLQIHLWTHLSIYRRSRDRLRVTSPWLAASLRTWKRSPISWLWTCPSWRCTGVVRQMKTKNRCRMSRACEARKPPGGQKAAGTEDQPSQPG